MIQLKRTPFLFSIFTVEVTNALSFGPFITEFSFYVENACLLVYLYCICVMQGPDAARYVKHT